MDDAAATLKAGPDIERLLDRALLTAHLLTGSLQRAEEATLEMISSWRLGEEFEGALFQNVLEAASRAPVEPTANNADSSSYLPKELEAVLRLAPQLRRCFVLRILTGLPTEVCARLLCSSPDVVDRHTCDALRCLALGA